MDVLHLKHIHIFSINMLFEAIMKEKSFFLNDIYYKTELDYYTKKYTGWLPLDLTQAHIGKTK